MHLTRQDYGGESENLGLGLAWLRVSPQYLPDVRAEHNGWSSTVVVRNESATKEKVTVTYLRADGSYAGSASTSVNHHGAWTHSPNAWPTYLADFSGSAVVDHSEGASVAAVSYHSSTPYAAGGYLGISDPASALYLPLLQRNNWNVSSHIHVMNPGPANAVFQVHYQAEPGLGSGCSTGRLLPIPRQLCGHQLARQSRLLHE
jgi:hypothetical protein